MGWGRSGGRTWVWGGGNAERTERGARKRSHLDGVLGGWLAQEVGALAKNPEETAREQKVGPLDRRGHLAARVHVVLVVRPIAKHCAADAEVIKWVGGRLAQTLKHQIATGNDADGRHAWRLSTLFGRASVALTRPEAHGAKPSNGVAATTRGVGDDDDLLSCALQTAHRIDCTVIGALAVMYDCDRHGAR